jgi:glycosyltransferase involved in cell wall biosynthesis
MRYIWDLYDVYFGQGLGRGLPRGLIRLTSHYLRLWDVVSSQRVDRFVAASRFVAARIHKYYGRRSTVIYPPVEWDAFRPVPAPEKDYYLCVAANAPYKRVDLVLDAFRRLDRRVKIVGAIPAKSDMRRGGDVERRVEWLGWRPDAELRELYAHCRALVFPGTEDFGIVPLEAQAAGRPVIAYGQGGVLESVRGIPVEGVGKMSRDARQEAYTGIFFAKPTGESLASAIEAFEAMEGCFEPERIRLWVKQFDVPVFKMRWKQLLDEDVRSGSDGCSMAASDGDAFQNAVAKVGSVEKATGDHYTRPTSILTKT